MLSGSRWDFSTGALKFMEIKCFTALKFTWNCYLSWKLRQLTALSQKEHGKTVSNGKSWVFYNPKVFRSISVVIWIKKSWVKYLCLLSSSSNFQIAWNACDVTLRYKNVHKRCHQFMWANKNDVFLLLGAFFNIDIGLLQGFDTLRVSEFSIHVKGSNFMCSLMFFWILLDFIISTLVPTRISVEALIWLNLCICCVTIPDGVLWIELSSVEHR